MMEIFQPDLLKKYDQAGPRYTSYPTAVQFNTDFTVDDYQAAVRASNQTDRQMSLYFHLPFCSTVCFFCACNKIITNNRKRSAPYLSHLYHEMALQSALFDQTRVVKQLHWGGGTPTFLSADQMRELMQETRHHFQLLPDDQGEYSIEVDPRETNVDTIALLRELGFNRLSLGVQDFDPQVQQAVNRIQPKNMTLATLTAARETGFKSVSLDLIYGLPYQTVDSFSRTLDAVLELLPDRLAVFNYAHLPSLFKNQKQMDEATMPTPAVKLAILQRVIERLTQAGYVYIGMDHFARPDDELALAQKAGTLYRNFQGYSTHADCDLLGMGLSSIGQIGDIYMQNVKDMPSYEAALTQGQLPLWRGVKLSVDDRLRRSVITQLMCNFMLSFADLEQLYRHEIEDFSFVNYFEQELMALSIMSKDGLLSIDNKGIRIHPAGCLLIRHIGMVFDRYLNTSSHQRFSRVI